MSLVEAETGEAGHEARLRPTQTVNTRRAEEMIVVLFNTAVIRFTRRTGEGTTATRSLDDIDDDTEAVVVDQVQIQDGEVVEVDREVVPRVLLKPVLLQVSRPLRHTRSGRGASGSGMKRTEDVSEPSHG